MEKRWRSVASGIWPPLCCQSQLMAQREYYRYRQIQNTSNHSPNRSRSRNVVTSFISVSVQRCFWKDPPAVHGHNSKAALLGYDVITQPPPLLLGHAEPLAYFNMLEGNSERMQAAASLLIKKTFAHDYIREH